MRERENNMSRFNRILRKLASPRDRELLDHSPPLATQLRIVGRVGLRFWWAYLILFVLLALSTVSAGMDVYHRTEQPQFCGACHEMSHNFQSWEQSRHKNITCADCHSQHSVLGWMRTKAAGLKQLRVHFTSTTISDIKLEKNQRGVISENCQRCHPGVARVRERLGLGVSHRQHLDKGVDCLTCHTGAFTHPVPADKAEAKKEAAPPSALSSNLVDVGQCFRCHDGKSTLSGTVAFDSRNEGKCLECHPDAKHALAHGARRGESLTRRPCLDCHEAKEGQSHFQMAAIGSLCEKCHPKQTGESEHYPYRSGACQKCHKVMSPAYLYAGSPRPTSTLCLGCHKDTAASLVEENPEEIGEFKQDNKNLHKLHSEKLASKEPGWCLECHAPHQSSASRALLRLRPGSGKRPATFSLTEPAGGRCQGGCHDSAEVAYSLPATNR